MTQDENKLAYWQEQFNAEQAEILPCSPDPEHDLDDEIAEMIELDDERQYFASRF